MKTTLRTKTICLIMISSFQLIVFNIISNVFDFETHNSWYSIIVIYTVFGTILGFLIKIVKSHKTELLEKEMPPGLSFFFGGSILNNLYFVIGLIAISLTAIPIAIFLGIVDIV